MNTPKTPVVLIHGLWLHASSWEPWCDLFADAGYAPVAPGWPGEAATVADARANALAVADQSIEDVVSHFRRLIRELPSAPILIGHSFGGLFAEKLLGEDLARAAIALPTSPSVPTE